ncbi:MAG: ChbG/HpnK family deacetylase [Lachnospiraceae bacterium]|nr:ChbG/HpnK family deacetylase [Lachnospiraceae bacterium]
MIEIHADDYALTLRTSGELLSLMREGVLDGISVISNTGCFEECMDRLLSEIPGLPFLPLMSVHLNIVEGLSLSGDDGSYIPYTWKSLFFDSFDPGKRGDLKEKLKKEMDLQIRKGWSKISLCIKRAEELGIPCAQRKLRIDSHQHSHVIPVVWSALTEVIKEKGYEVEYIRCPDEPLRPFTADRSLRFSYSPVNLIKNRILRILSPRAVRFGKEKGFSPMYLWGLMMSGKMDAERVGKLYPYIAAFAERKGRDLEILFHPGRMDREELTSAIPVSSAESFYLSENRDLEKEGARQCRRIRDKMRMRKNRGQSL